MKINIHKSEQRSCDDHGWLISWHSFSFGSHFNPAREKFGVIRVLNDEIIKPDSFIENHHQRNLEILLIPVEGELLYKDTSEAASLLKSNEVAVISAGNGVDYSYGNPSPVDDLRLIQVWIYAKVKNIVTRRQMLEFNPSERTNRIQLIASPSLISDVLWINQDTRVSRLCLSPGNSVLYEPGMQRNDRLLMIYCIEGRATLNVHEMPDETKTTSEAQVEVAEISKGDSAEIIADLYSVRLSSEITADVLIIETIED